VKRATFGSMSYDERLASRVREALADRADVEEKRMFGGLAFMVGGHMACGIVKDDLMVRVGASETVVRARPHVRPMDFTGRPLSGMVYVGPAGVATSASLREWVGLALTTVGGLPPKSPPGAARSRAKARVAKSRARKR
jgi:hypothetical protein